MISLERFLAIEAWFETAEGSHDRVTSLSKVTSKLSKSSPTEELSDDDGSDDEDDLDDDRIREVKTLLFNTYRERNQEGMYVDQFTSGLENIC